jgi:hypothetical protein
MDAKMYTLLSAILPTYSGYIPDSVLSNYILYQSDRLSEAKALEGYRGLIDQTFTIDLMCKTMANLNLYYAQIRAMLKAIERTTQTYFIQTVDFDESCPELWEAEVRMNRKIITVTISYQI